MSLGVNRLLKMNPPLLFFMEGCWSSFTFIIDILVERGDSVGNEADRFRHFLFPLSKTAVESDPLHLKAWIVIKIAIPPLVSYWRLNSFLLDYLGHLRMPVSQDCFVVVVLLAV